MAVAETGPLCRACKREPAADVGKLRRMRMEPRHEGLCHGCIISSLTSLIDQQKAGEDERLRLALETMENTPELRLRVTLGLCVEDGCDQPPADPGSPWCRGHGEDRG